MARIEDRGGPVPVVIAALPFAHRLAIAGTRSCPVQHGGCLAEGCRYERNRRSVRGTALELAPQVDDSTQGLCAEGRHHGNVSRDKGHSVPLERKLPDALKVPKAKVGTDKLTS